MLGKDLRTLSKLGTTCQNTILKSYFLLIETSSETNKGMELNPLTHLT